MCPPRESTTRMTSRFGTLRRLFVGREVGAVLVVLIAGSLLTSAFVPGYIAVLLASGVRNVHLPWLGSGAPFYTVAFLFLYLEAVVLTAVYVSLRTLFQKYRNRGIDGTSP